MFNLGKTHGSWGVIKQRKIQKGLGWAMQEDQDKHLGLSDSKVFALPTVRLKRK